VVVQLDPLGPVVRILHEPLIVALVAQELADLLELSAAFEHHPIGRPSHGLHGQRAEQKDEQHPGEQPAQHFGVHERDVVELHELGKRGGLRRNDLDVHGGLGSDDGCFLDVSVLVPGNSFQRDLALLGNQFRRVIRVQTDRHVSLKSRRVVARRNSRAELAVPKIQRLLGRRGRVVRARDVPGLIDLSEPDLLDVGGQQRQCGQCRRSDREPLSGGGRRVPKGVQCVGPLADMRLLTGHFGVAAGVVGDRTVRIGGERNAQGRQHAYRGKADPVQPEHELMPAAGKCVGQHDCHDDCGQGRPGAFHPLGKAADHDCCGTGDPLGAQRPRRAIVVACVVLRRLANDHSCPQAGDTAAPHPEPVHLIAGDRLRHAAQ